MSKSETATLPPQFQVLGQNQPNGPSRERGNGSEVHYNVDDPVRPANQAIKTRAQFLNRIFLVQLTVRRGQHHDIIDELNANAW
nr:hypothetical protein [Tautonia marina]